MKSPIHRHEIYYEICPETGPMCFSYRSAPSDVNNFHFRPGRYLEEYNELAREHNQFVATHSAL